MFLIAKVIFEQTVMLNLYHKQYHIIEGYFLTKPLPADLEVPFYARL